jgi:hypothetical protein
LSIGVLWFLADFFGDWFLENLVGDFDLETLSTAFSACTCRGDNGDIALEILDVLNGGLGESSS